MHPKCWFAVVMLFGGLFILLDGADALTARDCPPAAGCLGSACPVMKYADYGSYCSYYAQYCTGDPTMLTNISVDSNCSHTMMPPYCAAGNCDDCIPLGSFSPPGQSPNDSTKKDKTKKAASPPAVHGHQDILKGLAQRGKLTDTKVQNPIPAGSLTASLAEKPVLAELTTTNDGLTRVRVQLYVITVDPSKETDAKKKAAIMQLKMMKMMFGNGIEVEKTADVAVPIPQSAITAVKQKVCVIRYKNRDYQVVLHKDTKVEMPTKKAKKEKK
jgi:hypothetical protein